MDKNTLSTYNITSAMARWALVWGTDMPDDENNRDAWFEEKEKAIQADFRGGLQFEVDVDIQFFLLDTPFVYERLIILVHDVYGQKQRIKVKSKNNLYITPRDIFTTLKTQLPKDLGDHRNLEQIKPKRNIQGPPEYELWFGS